MNAQIEIGTQKSNQSTPVNCTGYNSSAPTNSSSVSWTESYSNGSAFGCRAEQYTGRVCGLQLKAWQDCTLGEAESVYLEPTPEHTQAERERDVAQLLYFLRE